MDYILHEAEKKTLDLLFTVYSNINSNELTKKIVVIFFSRLICQDFCVCAFTHVAPSLGTSKNNSLLK